MHTGKNCVIVLGLAKVLRRSHYLKDKRAREVNISALLTLLKNGDKNQNYKLNKARLVIYMIGFYRGLR